MEYFYSQCKEGHYHRIASGYVQAIQDFDNVVEVPKQWFLKKSHASRATLGRPFHILDIVRFECPAIEFVDCENCRRNTAPSMYRDRSSLIAQLIRSFESRIEALERKVAELQSMARPPRLQLEQCSAEIRTLTARMGGVLESTLSTVQ